MDEKNPSASWENPSDKLSTADISTAAEQRDTTELPQPTPFASRGDTAPLLFETDYYPQATSRRFIIWSVVVIIALGLVVLSQAISWTQPDTKNQFRFEILPSTTASSTPSATLKPTVIEFPNTFAFLEPTATPTVVPGGQILVLRSVTQGSGWVVSNDESITSIYDVKNHLGDSFLYSGVLDGKIYHAAFQFDLSEILRGTKIYGASLRLTGLRAVQLDEEQQGEWQLQLLAPEIDYVWQTASFQQIHNANTWTTLVPTLTQADLGVGKINQFDFTPRQLAFLEKRIIQGNAEAGAQISFRLDGPLEQRNNLFAWDSGNNPTDPEAGPELFLNLGPPPSQTPLPFYVMVTETPTPENIMTAAANSLCMTAEATQVGTATPLPPNWMTPIVVTVTPTPQNRETAQVNSALATAIALTTGEPLNVVTATPTPTYIVVTSTPTPKTIMTALAYSLKLTAEAERWGTATTVPANWVTPVVVTITPTPANSATAEFWQALNRATGTPTPLPGNAQTATSTPTYMVITSTPTPEDIATAVVNSQRMTAEAARFGTVTPLPPNWVTPVVVTATPIPINSATVEYWQAAIFTTGTPTVTPDNWQTATPTPVFITVEPLASATPTATPSATPRSIPAILLGKILFLSDREGATEQERFQAGLAQATPRITPQPYVFDPETGQLGRLTDLWPYDVAAARDAWSADTVYEAYTQQLLWTNTGGTYRRPTEVLAIHYYDHLYKVEHLVTRMGTGLVYDPAWSPVSDEIAFVATESGNDEIWTIHHDSTDVCQLTRNEWEWDKHPSWSPDGQKIVFYSNRTGNNQLWIMNKDGSEQQLVLEWNPYNDWDPVWVKYLDPPPPLLRELDWRFQKPPDENQ